MRKTILLTVLATVASYAWSNPRTVEDMKSAAAKVLAVEGRLAGKRLVGDLQMQEMREGVAVMGYDNGGFAVVTTDDAFPEVMGWSETAYDSETTNPHFKWWLDVVDKVTADPANAPLLSQVTPESLGYPERVAPLLKTLWDQSEPYNDLCPNYCPTGCVATATAQVLKYFEWPDHGTGTVFTYFPFADFNGERLEAVLDNDSFDYNLMLNEYYEEEGPFPRGNQARKKAVAKLMYHVGLAMKAVYDYNGTGAYNETLCYGLRNNLRYPFAVTIDKKDYTDTQWMNIIFDHISRGIPIIYGGSDESYSGHEFVLNGYNKNGYIYINWGWGGSEDGYFNLASLLVYYGFYDFRYYQDLVVRCTPEWLEADTVEVTVETPGTLDEILAEQRDSIVCLKVKGSINSTDLRTLRQMAGRDVDGKVAFGNLSVLNLAEARVVKGGEPFLIEDDSLCITDDDVMPDKAFANCTFLVDVTLPDLLLGYGDGVFAGCNNLDRVYLKAVEESDFIVEGSFVMNKERDELIECLPGMGDDLDYVVPNGVKVVHPYAFAGRFLYERITLPNSVDSIGAFAFNRCFDLIKTYVNATTPPAIDATAIDPLDISLRTLYVPRGTKQTYRNAKGWKEYGRNIKEFDANLEDGIDEAENTTPAQVPAQSYDLQGRRLKHGASHHGVIVSKDGKRLVKP
ncbi:MAG: C10 family peptidase [Prevotella sp.]|nr:C10 family peptidase [Prevotella sp.]